MGWLRACGHQGARAASARWLRNGSRIFPCHTCAPRESKDLTCVTRLVPRCIPHTWFCQAQRCSLGVLKEMTQLRVVVSLYLQLLALEVLQFGGREWGLQRTTAGVGILPLPLISGAFWGQETWKPE